MNTRAVILAGGEGNRLGVLTAKRTKPAVPFAGKYRIIDFPLSNCVNSGIFDVMILAQYRPQSLIEHIGAGGPWDLNRDFTGGVRIQTPYKARGSSEWYLGTADAVQQNFLFIKQSFPAMVLILSGDHIYTMDYSKMIAFHLEKGADVTLASIRVPMHEASRYGILEVDAEQRVTSFIEKPANPLSNLVNMGVYLFNLHVLDKALWQDHFRNDSTHDFGKDILPQLVKEGRQVFTYPYEGYWIDVGTIDSYWQTHMALLADPPPVDLNNRKWIIRTKTEGRPPAWVAQGASIRDSMISDGCIIPAGAIVERSILSPGVFVHPNAIIRGSVLLTDCVVGEGAVIENSIIDKSAKIGDRAHVGALQEVENPAITTIGKHAEIPADTIIEPGAIIGPDVWAHDFSSGRVKSDEYLQTMRLPYEI